MEGEGTGPKSEEWIALERRGADQKEDSSSHKEVVMSSSQGEERERAEIMPDLRRRKQRERWRPSLEGRGGYTVGGEELRSP